MSRNTGTFNFAANFEGLLKAPIDAKQLVGTYADLTNPATWNASGQIWLYNGAMVTVGSDPIASNNGIYWLCDANNYTNTTSWVKAGTGSGAGTVSGATNGLHLINSGTTVVLGGDLLSGTTINGQDSFELNLINLTGFHVSGGTTEFILVPGGITMAYGATNVSLDSNAGLVYGADYSTNFVDESLITKRYADTIVSGLRPKGAVAVATTGPITLSGTSGTVDGISVATIAASTYNRILVKNQTSGATNGIYSASTGNWGRTSDFDGTPMGEVVSGSYMWVLTGTTNENTAWVLDTPDPITVGSTPLTFVVFANVADVIGGTGITVTMQTGVHTVSLNNETQTCLAQAITGVTNLGSGIAFCSGKAGNDLCLSTIVGSGLTSVSKVGDEIRIYSSGGIDTITGATNGLSVAGKDIKLGGSLTGITSICGSFPLNLGIFGDPLSSLSVNANGVYVNAGGCVRFETINGGSSSQGMAFCEVSGMCVYDIFNQRGLSYAANYWLNNQNNERWIPDKGYVDGLVTTGASVIGGFNGLGLLNRKICLGGTLINDTIINASGNTLCVNNGYLSTESGYQISGTTILRADPNDIDSIYIGDNANFNISGTDNIGIGSWTLKSTTTGSCNVAVGTAALSANTTGSGSVAIGYNAGMNETGSNKLIIANNANTCLIHGDFSTSGLTFNADIRIGRTPITGVSTDGFLVWNSADKCVKQVDVGSIISASITGATNGLTKVGQQVKLGGDLTGGTIINLCDNSLRLQSDSTNIYGLADFRLNSTYANSKFGICSRDVTNGIWALSGDSQSISGYHCADASNGSCLAIKNTGLTLTNKTSSVTCSVTLGTNALVYGGCYHSSYVNRTLVDKEYVDKQISGCSNMLKVRLQGGLPSFVMTISDDVVAVSGLSTNQICLPGSPALINGRGQRITVVDICGNALADPITINGNGTLINGGVCSTINTDYGSVTFVYNGFFWSAIAFVN